MALVFDSLTFARQLEKAGIKREHAEAHAEAVRDQVMKDLVTKAELNAALNRHTILLGSIVVAATTALGAFLAFMP